MTPDSRIEWVCRRLLPIDGWEFESIADGSAGELIAVVRRAHEAKRIAIPRRVLFAYPSDAFNEIAKAIDMALGIGRYATTPVLTPSSQWSPYP